MDESDKRRISAARNQSLFRNVNERIAGLNESFSVFTERGEWICECLDPACAGKMEMSTAEYERLREDPNSFAVLPGHELVDVEKVIERNERFLVVSKLGVGAAYATSHDPRKATPES